MFFKLKIEKPDLGNSTKFKSLNQVEENEKIIVGI